MRELRVGGMQSGNRTYIVARVIGDCKPFVVRAGETAAMPYGPPFNSVVTAGPMSKDGRTVPLALAVIGSAGEQLSALQVEGRQPPKPEFTITGPDGKVVHHDSFEYG
jgi:hypothetical protein